MSKSNIRRLKRKNTIILGISENKCSKCLKKMERRGHKEILPYMLQQNYYVKEWDYCRLCKHVQHYKDMCVYKGREDIEIMEEHFSSI